jgi:hypothetical protein
MPIGPVHRTVLYETGGMARQKVQGGTFSMNRSRLIGAAVLVAVGSLLGATGLLLGSTTVVSAARDWVGQRDKPPTDSAKRAWKQAMAAGRAGAKAWQGEVAS